MNSQKIGIYIQGVIKVLMISDKGLQIKLQLARQVVVEFQAQIPSKTLIF